MSDLDMVVNSFLDSNYRTVIDIGQFGFAFRFRNLSFSTSISIRCIIMLLGFLVQHLNAQNLGAAFTGLLVSVVLVSWFKPSILPRSAHAALSNVINVGLIFGFKYIFEKSHNIIYRYTCVGDTQLKMRQALAPSPLVHIPGPMAREMLRNSSTESRTARSGGKSMDRSTASGLASSLKCEN